MPLVITSLADLKTHLSITGAGEDTKLTQFLTQLESVFFDWANRASSDFTSAAIVEYHSGDGTPEIVLKRRPVTALTDVWLDSSGYFGQGADTPFPDSTKLTKGTDVVVENLEENEDNPAILRRLSGTVDQTSNYWDRGVGNIKVSYTAGYTTTPVALPLAFYDLAAAIRKSAETQTGGRIKSERHAKYGFELIDGTADANGDGVAALIASARSILGKYKEHAI